MARKLDRARPYQQSLGHETIHFIQDGYFFDSQGNEIGRDENYKPAPGPKDSPEVAALKAQLAQRDAEIAALKAPTDAAPTPDDGVEAVIAPDSQLSPPGLEDEAKPRRGRSAKKSATG